MTAESARYPFWLEEAMDRMTKPEQSAEREAVSRSLVAAVERRNTAARKVAALEDRLFEARRALNLAENRVNALHANAPHGTLIRFGDAAWEVQGRVRHNDGEKDA